MTVDHFGLGPILQQVIEVVYPMCYHVKRLLGTLRDETHMTQSVGATAAAVCCLLILVRDHMIKECHDIEVLPYADYISY